MVSKILYPNTLGSHSTRQDRTGKTLCGCKKRSPNVNISIKTNNTIGSIIKNNKDIIKKENKSRVYKVKLMQVKQGEPLKLELSNTKIVIIVKFQAVQLIPLTKKHIPNFDRNILYSQKKCQYLNLLKSLEINELNNQKLFKTIYKKLNRGVPVEYF